MRRTQLSDKILKIYNDSRQIFGAKKIKAILAEQGEHVSVRMVSELMQEMNLASIRIDAKKNYQRINDKKKTDVLKLDFTAKAPNQVWVSDITYFRLNNKFYYICVILDLYSRKAIAYRISQRLSTQIATAAFKSAYADR